MFQATQRKTKNLQSNTELSDNAYLLILNIKVCVRITYALHS